VNLQAPHLDDLVASRGKVASSSPESLFCTACTLSNSIASGSPLSITSWASWLERLPLRRDQQSARSRQTIYRAGETLDGVPVICDGWAARVSRLSDGRRQILSFVLPGDLVSTDAVFAGSLSFFVEAITAVRHSCYDRTDLNKGLAAEPSLIKILVGTCLAEKEQVDQLATNLGRRRAEERIARLFLHLKERLEARGLVRDQSFEFPLRQQHIADATGLTPVHVNRVLGALRNEGVIELSGGILKISNLNGLLRIADSK
jgi:CRP/FNR family transcriptional regulator, anaerobic regulatory protein